MNMEDESPANTAVRGISLLNELLALKSIQDGVQRAPIGVFGHMDAFSRDVHEVGMFMQSAALAMPLLQQLSDLGRTLEARGDVKVNYGETYAASAISYLRQHIQFQEEVAC
ncbi:hypothetical protein [Comamonas thiooxydans]|uniref:hypothetical protein n=1 Tax=Comamonas thiooxydans TaxID=363952 RepID=UPI00050F6068|nr:hypothetical protein [Comamonas thiooxydans]KGH23568.1 hypothetical protein P606_11665 [Comamonas thiooxydans]